MNTENTNDLEQLRALKDELTERSVKQTLSDLGERKENMSEDISHLRDTFLSAERDYAHELLKYQGVRETIQEINQQPTTLLFEKAKSIVEQVELGQVPDEEMDKTELHLFLLLGSIQDRVLKKDLVLTPSFDNEEELSNGRSR